MHVLVCTCELIYTVQHKQDALMKPEEKYNMQTSQGTYLTNIYFTI